MAELRESLARSTVTRIMKLIDSSGLQPGEPFATESKLATDLGVSRQTVREAVRTLRALGYLRSRQNVGLIIGKPDPVGLFENALQGYRFDTIEIHRLAELRFALEIGAVDLAIRRGTRELGERLEELAGEFDRAVVSGRPRQEQADVDLRFHRAILEATSNPVLAKLTTVLATFFERTVARPLAVSPPLPELVSWQHHAVARAFREGSAERARVHLSEHLMLILGSAEGGAGGEA